MNNTCVILPISACKYIHVYDVIIIIIIIIIKRMLLKCR